MRGHRPRLHVAERRARFTDSHNKTGGHKHRIAKRCVAYDRPSKIESECPQSPVSQLRTPILNIVLQYPDIAEGCSVSAIADGVWLIEGTLTGAISPCTNSGRATVGAVYDRPFYC